MRYITGDEIVELRCAVMHILCEENLQNVPMAKEILPFKKITP
jgi:hypothetical protein